MSNSQQTKQGIQAALQVQGKTCCDFGVNYPFKSLSSKGTTSLSVLPCKEKAEGRNLSEKNDEAL